MTLEPGIIEDPNGKRANWVDEVEDYTRMFREDGLTTDEYLSALDSIVSSALHLAAQGGVDALGGNTRPVDPPNDDPVGPRALRQRQLRREEATP